MVTVFLGAVYQSLDIVLSRQNMPNHHVYSLVEDLPDNIICILSVFYINLIYVFVEFIMTYLIGKTTAKISKVIISPHSR